MRTHRKSRTACRPEPAQPRGSVPPLDRAARADNAARRDPPSNRANGLAGVLVDPDAPCFDHVPGYKPVVGGVRHVTTLTESPLPGSVVETLCGAQYQVARRRRRERGTAHYDCSFCALEYTGVEP